MEVDMARDRLLSEILVATVALMGGGCSEESTAPGADRVQAEQDLVLCLSSGCYLGYKATDIGTLGSGSQASASAINDAGVVVGSSEISPGGKYHAFRYVNGVMQDLGTLPGDDESHGAGINEAGEIVGVSSGPVAIHGFVWRPFVQPGVPHMVDLGPVPGATPGDVQAVDINNTGQVIGDACCIGASTKVGFRHTAAGMVVLPGLPGVTSAAAAINDNGLAAGGLQTLSTQPWHAAKWPAAGGVSDLTLPGQYGFAYGVNQTGDIVGMGTFFYDGGSNGPMHALFWPAQGGSVWDLGTGHAYGISNLGRLVGSTHDFVPFTARPATGPRVLLPLPSGALAGEARAVNSCGTIVGTAHNASGPYGFDRAVIWSKLICDS
jgi:probable HAF family extracellular repeat protein